MSVASNISAAVAAIAGGGGTGDISFVPRCSAGISFQDFIVQRANDYDPASWDYFKATPSTQPPSRSFPIVLCFGPWYEAEPCSTRRHLITAAPLATGDTRAGVRRHLLCDHDLHTGLGARAHPSVIAIPHCLHGGSCDHYLVVAVQLIWTSLARCGCWPCRRKKVPAANPNAFVVSPGDDVKPPSPKPRSR